eukprot:CAMPEP_0175074922 /NCGR_PEP_ID=MMETSP0052_2-20121109/21643_1 /TAXON_ID=51329 ORGANISM="Polytomella parva, Strain SAG 63-3" /NCGR_SAMPLE_ID=MMETSP0052_2 /ASSEMBLY_ACC=CAM_ASM_000194 /LENGTH=38 /DNA_ID= /DNA_START= /DNA_END= /DNA_ORIENTATION=
MTATGGEIEEVDWGTSWAKEGAGAGNHSPLRRGDAREE